MFIRATLRRFAPQELLALKTVQAVFPVREGKLHCLIKNQKTAPPCQMQTQREMENTENSDAEKRHRSQTESLKKPTANTLRLIGGHRRKVTRQSCGTAFWNAGFSRN
jgi:hypothetical protein